MADGLSPDEPPQQDQLLEEASLWFARMRGPDAERYRPEFETWLALGAAHLGAYNRAGEIFALGKFLSSAAQKGHGEEETLRARGRQRLLLGGATVAVVAVGLWFGETLLPRRGTEPVTVVSRQERRPRIAEILSTNIGERREFALADGSVLSLAPGSTVSVMFDDSHRDLRLARGAARFEVAHEPRPFVVHAGDGSVTARGTIFEVTLTGQSIVTVKLLRGAVDIDRPVKGSTVNGVRPIVTRLIAGETLRFGGKDDVKALAGDAAIVGLPPDIPAPVLAEAVEFDHAPLSDVIARTNKSGGPRLRAEDPAVARLTVSGRFRIDDTDLVAEHLAALFDLRIDRSRRHEILLRSR
jgi:transmembrane sensor